MGLFGNFSGGGIGSSANTTTNTTDNKNNATSGDGSSIYDSRGGAINLTDGGAVENSLNFAGNALDSTYDFSAATLGLINDFNTRSLAFAGGAYADASQSVEKAYQQAVTGTEGLALKYNTAIVGGLIVAGALYFITKGKK